MSKDNTKVKGLLKGLRYISHIFENEKEPEMQIGLPTDVKHVAHIGWDGPSVNSPSWMNEFKSTPEFSSGPLSVNGGSNKEPDSSVKWVSEDSSRRGSRSVNAQGMRDMPNLPKSSRRQSTGSITDSPPKEKSEKSRQRKSSKTKDSSDGSRSTRKPVSTDSLQGSDSPARSIPDVPKKSSRKKSKDGSTRSRSKEHSIDPNSSELGSPSGSVSRSNHRGGQFDDGATVKGSSGIS